MKYIFTLLISVGFCLTMWAQQEEQYTQFMYYKLGFNPAFAGKDGTPSIAALTRVQWVGIEGAPQTQLITFNMPTLNGRVGIGGSIARQTIGVTENYTADAAYAYHVRLGNGTLGMGLQASVRLFRINFSETVGTQPIEDDPSIPMSDRSRYLPNFGAGLYYESKNAYVGFSIPRLLENNINLASSGGRLSKEIRHFYMMGGVNIALGDNVEMQPQILLKYVSGAPFDADVNMNFVFFNKFTSGVSYRIGGSSRNNAGESLSILLGTRLTEQLIFGISYDMTLSELRDYNSGSFEGVLRFSLNGRRDRPGDFEDPRFF
ncbi:MAG: type IX secretion system membrane protein PorP/SprF [Saprospiraceae bacterium]